jgi:DNA-directed RNA polymerase subunit K/omega
MKKLTISRTSLVDNDLCVANIGNRFDMVVVAAQRVRELRKMHAKSGNIFGPIDALLDIQAGKINRDEYLEKFKNSKKKSDK